MTAAESLAYLRSTVDTATVRTGVKVLAIEPRLPSQALRDRATPRHAAATFTSQSLGKTPLPGCAWAAQLSTGETMQFDFVLVATGRYHMPIVPPVLREPLRRRMREGTAFHTAWFRSARGYEGKTVFVIGGGPSGSDIAAICARTARDVVWAAASAQASVDRASLTFNMVLRGRIARIICGSEKRVSVTWAGDSVHGTRMWTEDIDADIIIIATGYQLIYPFLEPAVIHHEPNAKSTFPFDSTADARLVGTPTIVLPLSRHLFPLVALPDPTIAFIGLPHKTAPWTVMEAQNRTVARVWERTVARRRDPAIPPYMTLAGEREQIVRWYNRLGGSPSAEKLWHLMANELQFEYRRELAALTGEDIDLRELALLEEAHLHGHVMRLVWKGIRERGEEAQWLRGVGHGTPQQKFDSWISFMRRVYQSADVNTRLAAGIEKSGP